MPNSTPDSLSIPPLPLPEGITLGQIFHAYSWAVLLLTARAVHTAAPPHAYAMGLSSLSFALQSAVSQITTQGRELPEPNEEALAYIYASAKHGVNARNLALQLMAQPTHESPEGN